jgi:hypothetical protein
MEIENLVLVIHVANISVLGFTFSIVVAFNLWDYTVQEMSKVEELMKMEYTPMVVNEGTCQGLCSNQIQWPATVSVVIFHLLSVPSCMHPLKPLGQPLLTLVKLNIF